MAKAEYLARVGGTFTAEGFDWQPLKSVGLLYHCQRSEKMLCGKLLRHCKNQVSSLREQIGIRICCFKIGITSNPPLRFASYMEKNTTVCGSLRYPTVLIESTCLRQL